MNKHNFYRDFNERFVVNVVSSYNYRDSEERDIIHD